MKHIEPSSVIRPYKIPHIYFFGSYLLVEGPNPWYPVNMWLLSVAMDPCGCKVKGKNHPENRSSVIHVTGHLDLQQFLFITSNPTEPTFSGRYTTWHHEQAAGRINRMDLRVSCVILTAIHWEGCFLLTNINHYALRETYGRFNDSAVGQNSVPPWVSNTNSMRHFALHPQSLTVPPWRIVVGRRSFPIGARSLFRAFPIKLRVGNSESFICFLPILPIFA